MEATIKGILECQQVIEEAKDKMERLEEDLLGANLVFKGNHATVMFLSANCKHITLYVEDENGDSWEEFLPIEEVLELASHTI